MTVLASKVSVPRHPHKLVTRRRLMARLQEADHSCSFVLSAPAGYGKTTLAAQFLSEQPQNMKAWYTLESHDADPRRFASYLFESLSKPISRLRSSGLQDHFIGPGFDPVKFTDDIGFFLEEYKGPQVWCVLDNWEAVNNSSELCKIVERLINYYEVRLRVIITSRTTPAFHVRRLEQAGRIRILDQNDLRFSRPELAEAIELRSRVVLNETETEEVYKLTRGWCVTIGFIREMLKRGGGLKDLKSVGQSSDIGALRQYLEQEITSALDAEARTFLCHCSVLDTVSRDSCSVFDDDGENIKVRIRHLKESSLPLMDVGEEEFRFHPLFKDACYELLKRSVDSDHFMSLHRQAADYYLQKDNFSQAIELLFTVSDYDRLLELIHEHWFAFLVGGAFASVEEWLARIPAEKQSHPYYLEAKTRLLSALGHFKELEDYLRRQLEMTVLEKGHPALGTMWLQHRGSLLLTQKGYSYDDLLLDWQKFRNDRGPFDMSVLSGAAEILGFAAYAELRMAEARKHLVEALKQLPEVTHPNGFRYRTFIASVEMEFGKTTPARERLLELLQESRKCGATATVPVILTFLVRVLAHSGDFTGALEYSSMLTGAARDSKIAFDTIKVHADRYQGICHFYQGDVEIALRYLKDSMEHARKSYLLEFANSARILEYYSCLIGEEVRLLPPEPSDPNAPLSEESLHHRLHVVYRKARKLDLQEALKSTRQVRTRVGELGLKPWLVTCNFLAFWIEIQLGDLKEARTSLRQGLRVLKEIEWRNYPMANSEVTAQVVSYAYAWNIYVDQAGALLPIVSSRDLEFSIEELLADETLETKGRWSLIDLAIAKNLRGLTSIANLPIGANNRRLREAQREYEKKRVSMPLPPLNIKTFGEFKTIREGQKIEYARPQARLLLAWLFASHPKPLHEEVICESLWPKIKPERALANLRTIVSALRKSLDPGFQHPGKSYVVLDAERYSLSLPEGSKIDFIEFERLSNSIHYRNSEPKSASILMREFETAVELYQGDFLAQYPYEDSVSARREELKAGYFKVLEFYVNTLLTGNQLEKAEGALCTGLQHDPYWERGIDLLIDIYSRSNQTLKALRIYRQYESSLLSEFDLRPSPELQGKFEELLLS